MTHWLDDGLVGLVLLASALYAAVSLGPRGVRPAVLRLAGACLRRVPRSFGLGVWAERCSAAAARAQGSCGGCGSCASAEPAQSPAHDVRISPSQIGTRRKPPAL